MFDLIPDVISQEIFTNLIRTDSVNIQRIVSKGQASPESGWYDQDDNEWVIVLQGAAKISFESGEIIDLEVGSYLNIPAHTKHKVLSTAHDTETVWLAVHYR